MEVFESLIVGTITWYSGTTTPDENGKMPVMIQCIAGKIPNRNTITGTVAERKGFEVGKTYLIQVNELGTDDDFGKIFDWLPLKELSGIEIIEAKKELGPREIFYIDKPEGYNYQRKGDKVIGQQTLRQKEGKFHPAYRRTSGEGSDNPREVLQGSSTQNYSQQQSEQNSEEESMVGK